MYARALTWWTILKICLEERLIYRADFALGTLLRFLPFITQVFLWDAVYSATGGKTLKGYTYEEMIAYLLLTNISRAFSSMPGLASTIALQIRNGEVKKYLIQPIDMVGFLFLTRVAHKLVYYVVAFGPYALVFFLARRFFSGWPDATTLAAFAMSLVLSFLLGFFLEAMLGMVGFWLMEVSSLLFVYQLFSFFFSGQMFPIEILPGPVQSVLNALPMPYLAYFPAAVFLGKIPENELAWGLFVELCWVIALGLACRVIWHRGLKRYSGYGG